MGVYIFEKYIFYFPVMNTVELVFSEFIKSFNHPELPLRLASGCPSDAKGYLTSDDDISLLHENYNKLDTLFPGFEKKEYPDEPSCIYSTMFMGREVNIYATPSEKLANRSVIHRQNELELANYCPKLLAEVCKLKRQGYGTEPAWVKVLGLDGDPYELMLESRLELGIEKENSMS